MAASGRHGQPRRPAEAAAQPFAGFESSVSRACSPSLIRSTTSARSQWSGCSRLATSRAASISKPGSALVLVRVCSRCRIALVSAKNVRTPYVRRRVGTGHRGWPPCWRRCAVVDRIADARSLTPRCLNWKARAAAWTGTGSRLAFRSLACRAVRDLRWPDPAARYVREAGAQRTRRRVPTSSSGPPARAGVRPFRVADVVRDTLIDRPSAIAWERSLNGRAAPARL